MRNVVELPCRLGADEPAPVLNRAVASRTTFAPVRRGRWLTEVDPAALRECLGPTMYAKSLRTVRDYVTAGRSSVTG